MVFEQLEHFLTEQGFYKVLSNLPEFSFFFHGENTYVNVLYVIDYRPGLYITQDQYGHMKEKIREFFQQKGVNDIHIMSLLISADRDKAKELCGNDAFCWLIDSTENRLIIYENQVSDFYGMKARLENFLDEAPDMSTKAQEPEGEALTAGGGKRRSIPWVNILLILANVILFIICTFTNDLLYNIGDFSVSYLMAGKGWYRTFSSMFLHMDIQHLISNMLILYYIGNVVEDKIGHLPYIVIYLLSGVAGDILSAGYELFTGQAIHSVGASGAVFGIEGALLMLVLVNKDRDIKVTARRLAFAIAFSLYCGFTSSNVNNMAHIGGVFMGFAVAGIFWLLRPRGRTRKAG
ncbi:MAG: rhomboid family intramembrane serine protease [Muribaculaceae bacterium]|nr:rhomboid family intramembrane serine protease [Muribaculaceae bacterium]